MALNRTGLPKKCGMIGQRRLEHDGTVPERGQTVILSTRGYRSRWRYQSGRVGGRLLAVLPQVTMVPIILQSQPMVVTGRYPRRQLLRFGIKRHIIWKDGRCHPAFECSGRGPPRWRPATASGINAGAAYVFPRPTRPRRRPAWQRIFGSL